MEQTVPLRPATILDYWRVLRRYWLMIAALVFLSVVGTWIWCKMSPKLYEAKATLLPAPEPAGGGGGISFGGDKDKGSGPSMAMEALTGKTAGPNVMEILHALLVSRRMAEALVQELNLMEYYGTPSLDLTIMALQGQTDVRASPFKTYEVTVLTRDPEMAAVIANAYVEHLDRLHRELNVSATKRHRVFLENRLAEKAKTLAEAESALRELQTEQRVLNLPDEVKAAMGAAAELHGQIVQLEVELAALRSYATPNHPMINQLRVQLAELRHQLDELEKGQIRGLESKRARAPMSKKLFTEFEKAPTLALDLLRLTRQVKVEESVYGMLVGMLEQARIGESRDVPTIQQLDKAVPAKFPSRPKTLQNLQAAAALSLILGIMLTFFLNYLAWLRAQEAAASPEPEADASDLLLGHDGNGNKLEVSSASPQEVERLHG